MRLLTSYPGRTLLVSGAAALVLAGCSSDDGGDATETGGGGTPESVVSVVSFAGTDVLADAEGHTLYTADVEKGGRIRCVDACTSFWKPMIASADDVDAASDAVGDELGLVDRPDGESQLTYDGLPLYSFTEESAGEIQGDGFTDDFQGIHFEWSAATTGEASSPSGTPDSPEPSDPGYGY